MKFLMGLCIALSTLTSAMAAGSDLPSPPVRPRMTEQLKIPMPRERPPEIVVAQAPVTNPDPFNVNRANQAPAAQAPSFVPAAPAQQPAPQSSGSGILSLIQTALGFIATALFGKMAFFPSGGASGSSTAGGSSKNDIAAAFKAVALPGGMSFISDPALRSKIEAAFIEVVKSGIPGTAIQAGISLIPGASAIGGVAEPALRKVVVDVLTEMLGHQPAAAAGTTGAPAHPPGLDFQPLLDKLKEFLDSKARPAQPAA